MFKWIRKNRFIALSVLGYTLFALLSLFLFLYLTFPYEKFQKMILAIIEEKTSIRIKVEEGGLRFPFGIQWKGVHFFLPTNLERDFFTADSIRAEVEPFFLLRRIVEIPFSIHAVDGEFNGRLSMELTEREIGYLVEGIVKNLDLRRLNLQEMGRREEIEGRIKGEIRTEWRGRNFPKGKGSLEFEVSDVRLKNLKSSVGGEFPLPEFFFTKITGKVNLREGIAHLENFLATGPEIEISGNGDVLIKETFPESLINLSFNLHLKRNLKTMGIIGELVGNSQSDRPLRFLIRGTLRRPLFYLNEMPLG